MLKKNYTNTGEKCRVTFRLAAETGAQRVNLAGEFNAWNETSHPMKQLKNGDFSITVTLEAGQSYRFRYLLDGERWENDWDADTYLPNPMGTEDSVVKV